MVKNVSKTPKIKIDSKWVFVHSSKKLTVKVFAIENSYVDGKKVKSVIYGLPSSANGHICSSVKGFLENYRKVEP
jgi:hypothetical protein